MTFSEADLPSPAWRLKEVSVSKEEVMFIFQYATYRTNQELWVHKSRTGGAAPYSAYLTGAAGKVNNDVTHRLTQRRWDEIYSKAMAAYVLLGRKPEMIEEIF